MTAIWLIPALIFAVSILAATWSAGYHAGRRDELARITSRHMSSERLARASRVDRRG